MPIYEYQCGECGHRLEALQKMSEQPLQDCPACTKPALNKLISAAGFRLSGAGWYETDSKTGAKKNLTGGGASANSATTESSAATVTTTPAAAKSDGAAATAPSVQSKTSSSTAPNKAAAN